MGTRLDVGPVSQVSVEECVEISTLRCGKLEVESLLYSVSILIYIFVCLLCWLSLEIGSFFFLRLCNSSTSLITSYVFF